MYVRFPLSLRNAEDLLHERGIDLCHETAVSYTHLDVYKRQSLAPNPYLPISPLFV